jgi:hypothetical protein
MIKKHAEPKIVKPEDIDPRRDWNSPLMALGQMAVDFEERVISRQNVLQHFATPDANRADCSFKRF